MDKDETSKKAAMTRREAMLAGVTASAAVLTASIAANAQEKAAAPKLVGKYLAVETGVDLYYEEAGEGPAIVFVPGWTLTTRVFEHQFAHFAATNRVISFDPRSHGRSTVTLQGNNYATHAQDLAALLDQLKVEKPVLVGWSAGALAAWHYVRNNGTDKLAGFVNIDMPPVGTTTEPGVWIEGGFKDLAGFFGGVQSQKGLRDVIVWYADNVMIQKDLTPEVTAWLLEQSNAVPALIAANLIADVSFANYLAEAKLVDSKIPSLHVAAEHWSAVAKPFIAANCPKSTFESFGGHMMFWEYPEKFNAILSKFVKKT
ncbi:MULTISPECIES: alpha/beta hydrolase [Mesorhizobium]|uniref:alpha/beta fold hydrolase n=1 Tax=Mesorhizobium TaxID=68287 RepID=UPI0009F41494|nr:MULTISPECIES: alpha/beta hydrolase [Mesorhizobium]PBB52487.1 alpha/beta hydrolase [Mesorhizobium loti]QIA25476.1 alpha/beta hydrolase [Mesorhizobium sp. AA22]